MGGLVARSFLVDYGQTFPEVRTLTSIATPWGGDSMAGKGAQHSPVMLPVWNDMAPNSEFFKSIYRRSLPSGMAYHLPGGEYCLTIDADGFKPYTECHQVIPGKPMSPKGIELTPLLSTER